MAEGQDSFGLPERGAAGSDGGKCAEGGGAGGHYLPQLKHYRSLIPLAMEAHKPMFHLKPADGAIGAHVEAVKDCRADFADLARRIRARVGSGG